MAAKKTFLSLGEQIFQMLKGRVLDNHYMPGEVLQIDKLAEEFGVSSTPVRETLLRLDGIGLVRMIRNKGAVVSEIDGRMVRDVWQFRSLLETFASRESAARIGRAELRALREKVLYLIETPGDFELYKKTDVLLHDMLCDKLENALVRDALDNLQDHSRRIRYFAESILFREEVVTQVSREHLRIVDALAGNPEEIEEAVRDHLTNGMERALRALAAGPARNPDRKASEGPPAN
jgi:DNA-binding GntR family transcriptional regulator